MWANPKLQNEALACTHSSEPTRVALALPFRGGFCLPMHAVSASCSALPHCCNPAIADVAAYLISSSSLKSAGFFRQSFSS
jgi:hypothetical protein